MYVLISASYPELPLLPFFDKSSAKNAIAAMTSPVARIRKKVLVSFNRKLTISLLWDSTILDVVSHLSAWTKDSPIHNLIKPASSRRRKYTLTSSLNLTFLWKNRSKKFHFDLG